MCFTTHRVAVTEKRDGALLMMNYRENPVDLRSDTVTKPSQPMREAMAQALVGDDVFGEDPTVNLLQQRVATMLGKEASLFVPSGTMANLLGSLSQTRPGDTILLSEDAHVYNSESANVAMVGGLLTCRIPCPDGLLSAELLGPLIDHGGDVHHSPTKLISIENTCNRRGGTIYPLETVGNLAKKEGLRVHCDGARIFNAVVETGVSVSAYAEHCDTISFCFSKGLGAPVGSILVGNNETIKSALRFRKMIGGGMRQAGVLAAAALYALENNIQRLQEDHRRARHFRQSLQKVESLGFTSPAPTNMVFLDVPERDRFIKRLAEQGVLVVGITPGQIRAVFHLDVDDPATERAISVFKQVAAELFGR